VSHKWPLLRLRDPEISEDRFAEIGPGDEHYLLGFGLLHTPDYDLLLYARTVWPQRRGRRLEASAEVAAQLRDRHNVPREAIGAATGIDPRGVGKRITSGRRRAMQRESHPIRAACVEITGHTTADLDPRFVALLPRDPDVLEQWSRASAEGSEALRRARAPG